MSPLRRAYLALTIIGAVVPLTYFGFWFAENGFSLIGFFQAWRANWATRGVSMDLILSGIALIVWIVAETRVRGNRVALWAIPATCFIGVSCGLPLYLFLRTRPV